MSRVAVLIPCYNEELTIKKVINDFRHELPDADIYVYDNNSKDKTNEIATKEGAIVRKEVLQGKGNVIRSMFMDVDADVYIMVDGDDTYPADEVHKLIKAVEDGYDMVIGDRLSNGTYAKENKRGFHGFGNSLVRNLINSLFSANVHDVMTGYRGFSKRMVKTMPVMSPGFQIETEMTAFCLANRLKIVEIPIIYRDRPEGSFSKLNTFRDGFRVLVTLFDLAKDYRPLLFFGLISFVTLFLGLIIGIPVLVEFSATHFITKVPSAILASSLVVVAIIMFAVAIILDSLKNNSERLYQYQLLNFSNIKDHKNA